MLRVFPCSEAAIRLETLQVYIPAVLVRDRLRRGRAFRRYEHKCAGPSSGYWLSEAAAGTEVNRLHQSVQQLNSPPPLHLLFHVLSVVESASTYIFSSIFYLMDKIINT